MRRRRPVAGDISCHRHVLVLTATPGTDSHQQLQLLSVIGTQLLSSGR